MAVKKIIVGVNLEKGEYIHQDSIKVFNTISFMKECKNRKESFETYNTIMYNIY